MQENMRPITNQDINSLYEDMKGMPQQYVNHYLLSGNPMQKLVAGMVKDQRASVKTAPPAPTQTVLDQKAQAAEPGVAALPVREDMFAEESYANGGIVAFADGGALPEFRATDVTAPVGRFAREVGETVAEYLARVARESGMPVGQLASDPEIKKQIGYGERENLMVPEGSFDFSGANAPAPALAPSGPPAGAPAGPSVGGYGAVARRDLMQGYAKAEKGLQGILDYKSPYAGDVKAGLGMLKERAAKPAVTKEEALAEAAKMYEGEPYAEYKSYLESKVKGAEGEKSKAGWAAAMMAGLGMASGKSQYALTNIAEGATKGADYYLDKINKIDAANEQYQKGLAEIAQAKRLEQRDMQKEAKAVYERGQERMESAQDKYLNVVGRMEDSDKQVVRDVGIARSNLGAKEGEARAGIRMDEAKMAQQAAQHAQTIRMYENKLATAVGEQKARLLAVRANVIKNLPNDPNFMREITALDTKYKDYPDKSLYNSEVNLIRNKYIAEGLGVALESMGSIPTAESYGAE